MLRYLVVGALTILFASAAAAQSSAAPAAWVFGIALDCRDLEAHDPAGCAGGLLRYVRAEVARHFIARNGLEATVAELERLTDYNQAFAHHDRSQRKRKLAELAARLASDALDAGERARLEAFRAVLLRLAAYESDLDAGVETRAPIGEETLRGWIETVKLNQALYARYGGTIGIETYGPYAHGAMRRLIVEHVEKGEVRILDVALAERFFAALDAPPRLAHTGGEPDFTPFWERPLVPSYLPH